MTRPACAVLAAIAVFAPGCVGADAAEPIVETEATAQSTTVDPPVCDGTEDLMADAANCGACGTVCTSGLCFAGVCADDVAGHVFVIGQSYRTSNPALDRVLGNAVFLSDKRPIQIVTWQGPPGATTPADIVAGTNAALTRASSMLRRGFRKTRAVQSSQVQTLLPTADVFLVYAQPQATDDYLAALADEWRLPLDDFTRRGGIIVVLDAASANAGTPQVLAVSGVMTVTRAAAQADHIGFVTAHDDVAAALIPLMFAVGDDAVGYDPTPYQDVAITGTGAAIVVHRAIY